LTRTGFTLFWFTLFLFNVPQLSQRFLRRSQ
jgi:hypothetical protein